MVFDCVRRELTVGEFTFVVYNLSVMLSVNDQKSYYVANNDRSFLAEMSVGSDIHLIHLSR